MVDLGLLVVVDLCLLAAVALCLLALVAAVIVNIATAQKVRNQSTNTSAHRIRLRIGIQLAICNNYLPILQIATCGDRWLMKARG